MKRTVAILSSIMLTIGALAGGSTGVMAADNTAEELEELRVAVIPVISSLPVQYIIDQGWDVENGFKIEKVVFSSGAPMGEALVSNLWDIGIMSAAGVYTAANYDGMCIADTSDSIGENGIGVFARPDSEIIGAKGSNPTYPGLYGDAETVKGKTILCPTGTISQMQVFKWLEKIGLTKDDVSIVHMEYAQAYQAFLSGQGDLVALNPPFCFDILDEGMIDVASASELDVKLHDMVFANKQTYEEKNETIRKCIDLMYKAGEELEADPQLKKDSLKNWYEVNGSQVDDATIEKEAMKKLFTLDDIREMDVKVGETLVSTAEFFAEIGTVENDRIPVVKENINDADITALLGE